MQHSTARQQSCMLHTQKPPTRFSFVLEELKNKLIKLSDVLSAQTHTLTFSCIWVWSSVTQNCLV